MLAVHADLFGGGEDSQLGLLAELSLRGTAKN